MPSKRKLLIATICAAAILLIPSSERWQAIAQTGCAGVPFTDVTAGICSAVTTLYYTGITLGSTATTYSPDQNTTRGQMALFLSRSQDITLKRSRRGAMGWWYTPKTSVAAFTSLGGGNPTGISSDGVDLWVAAGGNGTVTRVRASDGRILETWTGATGVSDVLAIGGRVYVTGSNKLYLIDPRQPAGAVTDLGFNVEAGANGMTYDGQYFWRAGSTTVTRVAANLIGGANFGPLGAVRGIVHDGTSTWIVTSTGIRKNVDGALAFDNTDIPGGFSGGSGHPCFDGVNLIIPDGAGNRVVIVRANTSQVIGILTGNGLSTPTYAAIDGERLAVTNTNGTVSIFRAADFAPLGVVTLTGAGVLYQVVSDGLNFWVLDATNHRLYRL